MAKQITESAGDRGRAPNGRSSIFYSESDHQWHGWVTMGVKNNGEPDRRHRVADTAAKVTEKVQKLERQRDAGTAPKAGESLTVAAWLDLWLTTIAPRRVSQDTLDKTYEPKVRRWIKPGLGKHRLDRLQPEHLDAFYMDLEGKLSGNSIVQVHRILSRALKVAVQRGKTTRNVATLIDPPTGEDVEIEPLTRAEARRILDRAGNRRNGTRWSVALAAGVRQGEALGLRWKYVDLDAGTIEVGWQLKHRRFKHGCDDVAACTKDRHRRPCPKDCPKAKRKAGRRHHCIPKDDPKLCAKDCAKHARECPDRVGGGWEFTRRKGVKPGTGKAKIVITLPKPLVADLRQHRAKQNTEKLAAGNEWEDWDLVYCQPNGKPIDARQDWLEWRDLLEEADVREARVHDARHTAATLLLERGVGIRTVQAILGHSQLSQTQRYTHVTEELTTDAAIRMGEALWG